MRTICFFTGTRAEYGLLKPLISAVRDDSDLQYQLVVSGMHLSHEFGNTSLEIDKDGFDVTEKIEMLMSSDTPVGIAKSTALGLASYCEALERLIPDLLVLLGDRFEALAMATAALFHRIPVAHIHGGELTYGLIDESIRHSITKMSHLHFVSTEVYRRRVIQLGENPERVFNVGALGAENQEKLVLPRREQFAEKMSVPLDKPFILVTYHPVTLEENSVRDQITNILDFLERKKEAFNLVFTKANADTHGRGINEQIEAFVGRNPSQSRVFSSMGIVNYYSAMQYCYVMIGNSSSGILESPAYKTPCVNIGDRQKGRIQADNVVNCTANTEEIEKAFQYISSKAYKESVRGLKNPYYKEGTADRVLKVIKGFQLDTIIKKDFYDINQ